MRQHVEIDCDSSNSERVESPCYEFPAIRRFSIFLREQRRPSEYHFASERRRRELPHGQHTKPRLVSFCRRVCRRAVAGGRKACCTSNARSAAAIRLCRCCRTCCNCCAKCRSGRGVICSSQARRTRSTAASNAPSIVESRRLAGRWTWHTSPRTACEVSLSRKRDRAA